MLNCVYHPIDDMRVVSDEERETLLASGFWFDSPLDARAYRDRVENEVEKKAKPRGRAKKENTDA